MLYPNFLANAFYLMLYHQACTPRFIDNWDKKCKIR